MKIAILGYGKQGSSAYEYWSSSGNNTITVCDINTELQMPPGAHPKLGGDYLSELDQFDILVRSPSLHPRDIKDANPDHPEIFDKITTNTNEFFKVCPAPIIAVTGTKGKGTTSSLIAAILQAKGYTVHLGGNIGTPPLDLLKAGIKPTDIVVLELANFQLIDLKHSPKTAVCLMVEPEHLDWHTDIYEYIHAKQQLFVRQKHDDLAIYNARSDYSEEVATASPGIKLTYEVPDVDAEPQYTTGVYLDGHNIMYKGHHVCSVHDIKLPGRHNIQNVCAALAATWELVERKSSVIKKALKDFKGLPHRLETVAVRGGVTYVDDSFGTTPETARVALEAYTQPKVAIVGGSSKGSNMAPLVEALATNNVRHVVAIGEMGPEIVRLMQSHKSASPVPYTMIDVGKTMKDIVDTTARQAIAGDVVLLSTGCASFDMFKNYEDRGEQFKAAVNSLPE